MKKIKVIVKINDCTTDEVFIKRNKLNVLVREDECLCVFSIEGKRKTIVAEFPRKAWVYWMEMTEELYD